MSLALRVDIPRAISNLRFFAGAVRHAETGAHMMSDAVNYTIRKPIGVVALITPWNLPLYLLTWKLGPALAMGNTVVAKPSELTPTTATMLAEIFHDIGAPNTMWKSPTTIYKIELFINHFMFHRHTNSKQQA